MVGGKGLMDCDSVLATSKRNFYLMLSPPDGQDIATCRGFFPSSEEVYEEEEKDVLRSWAILTEYGIVDSLSDAADWMADVMVADEMLPPEAEDTDSVTIGVDLDLPEEDFYSEDGPMDFNNLTYADLKRIHQQIKESTYNTLLGCMVSSVSKLLDEDLIEVRNLNLLDQGSV
jgi:hypothetical protein